MLVVRDREDALVRQAELLECAGALLEGEAVALGPLREGGVSLVHAHLGSVGLGWGLGLVLGLWLGLGLG